MAKGKKFDAAEKHFQKLEIELRRQFNVSQNVSQRLMDENFELKVENKALKRANEDIEAKYFKLLELSKLVEEDIERSIRNEKSIEMFASMFGAIGDVKNNY